MAWYTSDMGSSVTVCLHQCLHQWSAAYNRSNRTCDSYTRLFRYLDTLGLSYPHTPASEENLYYFQQWRAMENHWFSILRRFTG